MGKIFYDMGLLSQAKVEECSATDMIGQYVGQTGPKVQKLMEKAMGKVLFIDEAYRLAEGGFATEAMDELVDCLTKPKYARKLVTILAGYDKDIDRLMSMNPGLTSRFPESVIFKHLEPNTCLELLVKVLADIRKRKKVPLAIHSIDPPSPELHQRLLELFSELSVLDSWGNARDVKSLAKSMFGTLISSAVPPFDNLVLSEATVTHALESMLDERSRRGQAVGTSRFSERLPLHPLPQAHPQKQRPAPTTPPKLSTKAASPPSVDPQPAMIKTEEQKPLPKIEKSPPTNLEDGDGDDPISSILNAKRDPGVSDATWNQLELDKHAMLAQERTYRRIQQEKREEEERIEELKRMEQAAADEQERCVREAERVAAQLERRRKDEELAAIEREREMEKERQKKLRVMGPCPAGYRWIKQSGGYRCAGGSHWLDDGALGI